MVGRRTTLPYFTFFQSRSLSSCRKKVIGRVVRRPPDTGLHWSAEQIHHLQSIRYILKALFKMKKQFQANCHLQGACARPRDSWSSPKTPMISLVTLQSSRFFRLSQIFTFFLKNFASYITSIGNLYSKFNISSPVKYYY